VSVDPEVRGRVLIVDDDPSCLMGLSLLLKGAGFLVHKVGGGSEALGALEQGAFDVLLTDFRMPTMDGLELAKHARARRPGIAVILMSAQDDRPASDLGFELSYLVKPLDLDEVIASIDASIARAKKP
jgi:DNA-binding response OmpR family regulator